MFIYILIYIYTYFYKKFFTGNTFATTVKLEKSSLWPMHVLQHTFLLRNMSHIFIHM